MYRLLAGSLVEPLGPHLVRVCLPHEEDLRAGDGRAHLPYALERKYQDAASEWVWPWVFPSVKLSNDPHAGEVRRHRRASEEMLRSAVKRAAREAGGEKRMSCHTLRHSFAAHPLESGYGIRRCFAS